MSKAKSKRKAVFITAIVAVGIVAAGFGVFQYFYSRLNYKPADSLVPLYEPSEQGSDNAENNPEETAVGEISSEELSLIQKLLDGKAQENEQLSFVNKDVMNILLIGVDTLTGNSGRSDSMIIVTVSKITDKIIFTSLMRDTYIKIPGFGYNRLNAAFSFGGAKLLTDTIRANYGINTDAYVCVNFEVFVEIIDSAGGLDLELTDAEANAVNKSAQSYCKTRGLTYTPLVNESAGVYHLDGPQTLAYARLRYVGNADYQRTERQRIVLSVLAEKMKGKSLPQLSSLLLRLFPDITTDLSRMQCLALLTKAVGLADTEIESIRIPADGTFSDMTVNGMSVLNVDIDANMEKWNMSVYGKDDGQ